ncbi:glycosyl hydrolase [Chryseotalea sanaruensis]|uniref:Glycosyl hydrolase n=2 Tax=Chryseotalea sanaruensis TaxID=2482724 RepID=A0A401UB16_9BACT|nr:glycosyl hydrolase [Chryseotalea sanaruensis]
MYRMKSFSIYLVLLFASFALINCSSPKEEKKETSFQIGNMREAYQYTTADSADLRLSITDTLSFNDYAQPLETEVSIFINPSKTFQTMLGIGGAITDASAETFAKLSADKQEEFINAYYNAETGIGYTLGRTHINSSDFSSESYTYVKDNDAELTSFDIAHDKQMRIPLLKKAQEKAGSFTLFVSPWSPPAWMKDNNNMLRGGKLKPEYHQSWANYYAKFIKAYEAEGLPIWGLTVQNEPMANQTWESCIFSAEDERDFIKNFLGPTLAKEGLADKKIIAWDHNRDLMYQRAETLFSDPEAAKYIWGLGFHWYEDWAGGKQMFDNVRKVSESWPEKNLFFTEGCNCPFSIDSTSNWKLGERYGESMINDFNNGTVAWTDWNILLDETGGPNHVKNFCFAPIHADTRNGQLIYTNAYYYLGHFSKFIRPGAKRVQTSASRSSMLTTAFLNTDNSLVVVAMNKTSKKISCLLSIDGKVSAITVLPHSISTVVLK